MSVYYYFNFIGTGVFPGGKAAGAWR